MSLRNSYLLVLATVALTVYGQIVIKWQVAAAHAAADGATSLFRVITGWLTNLWILSALFSAFLASITWMLAMRSLPLSRGYPLMSLTFVLVVMAGSVLFQEHISLTQMLGMALIVGGVSLVAFR